MRWEDLFADLEGRAQALAEEDLAAEIADRTRGETAQIQLVNRLRAHVGRPLVLQVWGAGPVSGVVSRVASDHVLLDVAGPAGTAEVLVVTGAVLTLVDLAADAVSPESVGVVASRLGLAAMLRGISADRSPVAVLLRDGTEHHGTLARVGSDWVELAEHHADDAPRQGHVHGRRTVPFASMATVRRRPAW